MPDKRKEDGSSASAKKRAKVKGGGGGSDSSSKHHAASDDPDEESFTYDPVHFIRSHSKNNDPADIQTQIWEVVFEPDPLDADKTTTKVATCGGNSICIIDVNGGQVLMKYKHKELK